MKKHRTYLNTNNHWNPKLSAAFNKSSEFDLEILCKVEEKKEAHKIERELIKKEKANEYCCNVHVKEEGNRKGIKHSKATREKMLGRKHSKSAIEKLRQSALNRNTVHQCPHCAKSSTNYRTMARWHFDNCKHKPISELSVG
tara:strand:- start:770 stop:1195 length:426 start_codon:yes stop_codon:yes gene_type:complete